MTMALPVTPPGPLSSQTPAGGHIQEDRARPPPLRNIQSIGGVLRGPGQSPVYSSPHDAVPIFCGRFSAQPLS